jgi:hypothetical protein
MLPQCTILKTVLHVVTALLVLSANQTAYYKSGCL